MFSLSGKMNIQNSGGFPWYLRSKHVVCTLNNSEKRSAHGTWDSKRFPRIIIFFWSGRGGGVLGLWCGVQNWWNPIVPYFLEESRFLDLWCWVQSWWHSQSSIFSEGGGGGSWNVMLSTKLNPIVFWGRGGGGCAMILFQIFNYYSQLLWPTL